MTHNRFNIKNSEIEPISDPNREGQDSDPKTLPKVQTKSSLLKPNKDPIKGITLKNTKQKIIQVYKTP